MQATIEPGSVSGQIISPSSKSMTQRAYAAALLHRGKTIVHNAGCSDDELAALNIIKQLGADLMPHKGAEQPGSLTITGSGVNPVADHINCGESGLAARLFAPVAALGNNTIRMEGMGSLLRRPMEGFAEVLPAFGVQVSNFNGYLPVTLQGPFRAKSVTIDASTGSQLLSGILFALAHSAHSPVTLFVTNLKSTPYIDMTLEMLSLFGRPVTHKSYKEFYIDPLAFTLRETVEVNIEADWSSAAAFLVAGAIAGNITVRNLNINSSQADKALLDVLNQAGAVLSTAGNSVSVDAAPLRAFDFDATHCPDLFPVLSVLAACCQGESYIKGVHRLFHKESNRAESISDMLQAFDVPYSLEDDAFCITGVRKLQGTVIDSYGDHRIIMAAAIGALRARSRVDIMAAEAVSKSYPRFFEDLILCGGKCNLT